MKCPVCASTRTRGVYELHDDRYGYPGRFPLLLCAACGHRFLDFSPSDAQIAELYTRYYPRASFTTDQYAPHAEIPRQRAWREGLGSQAFRWVPHRVRVLDIGCGLCQTLGFHRARGCDAHGVDPDENVRAIADRFGFQVHIGLFDPGFYEPGFFDYVTMDQMLEHVRDPLATMAGVAAILRPGGRAIVATPNPDGRMARRHGQRWLNWHAPYHQQLFSRASLARAVQHTGLRVTSARTITSSDWLHFQGMHSLLYPAAGECSRFWSPEGLPATWPDDLAPEVQRLRDRQRSGRDRFDARLLDLLGLGDNHVFILEKS